MTLNNLFQHNFVLSIVSAAMQMMFFLSYPHLAIPLSTGLTIYPVLYTIFQQLASIINLHMHQMSLIHPFFRPIQSSGTKVMRTDIFSHQFLHATDRIVESVGEGVDEVTEGDSVIPFFLSDCGECVDCRSKKSNLCSNFPFKVSPYMHRHETSRFTDLKGEVLYHFLFVSSFSEYTVVDIAHVTKIDSSIPPNRACLLSCGVSTGNCHAKCYVWYCHFSLHINLNKLNNYRG